MIKSRKGWINYGVLALVLFVLFLMVDVQSVAIAVMSIPPLVLVLTLGLATLDRFVMGYKWQQLIVTVGGKLSIGRAVSAYYQSGLSSRLLPIPMASDLLRAYVVGQLGLPMTLVISSITIEKLIAWLASSLLALVSVIYLFTYEVVDQSISRILWISILISLALGMFGLIFALYRPVHRFGGRLAQACLPAKLYHLFYKVSDAILTYRHQPKALLINLMLALGEQLVQLMKFFVLGRALNIHLPLFPFLATIFLMLTVRRMLNYFESWGLAETGTVVMLTLLGIDETAAVALIFMNFVITTVASLPGVYLMYRNGLNPQRWMQGKEYSVSPKV